MSAARPYTTPPGFVLASEVERRYVQWLHRGRVPLSEITGLAGDGGFGKSTVAQDLGARTSRGTLGQLPMGQTSPNPAASLSSPPRSRSSQS
ncbi:MAG TPA: AAA family ATPase [Miltoncostaeaceae bacterium]|nr:AAA family ATPase [Miltoncostaeaceae bacterium]